MSFENSFDQTIEKNEIIIVTNSKTMLEKVHLIWQGGGWRYWNSKLEILVALLISGSIF